jgi:hypothetical protein
MVSAPATTVTVMFLSAASQQQLFCQQLANSNCFVSSFPTAIVLSAACQQQFFWQQLPNTNCFVSSFSTAIVLSAASQQQLFCQQFPNSNCFVSSFPTAIISLQARLLAAACNSSQQVDARIVSTHQQATAISNVKPGPASAAGN